MTYLNIEPFHFASEDIAPQGVPDINVNFDDDLKAFEKAPILFSVMLDDTGSPNKPVSEEIVEKLLNQEKFKPNVAFLETSLKPIVLILLELIDNKELDFSSKYIRLSRNGQLLVKSTKEKFDCRDLMDKPETYFLSEVMNSIKPTCAFYTVAWYLFRLKTPMDIFLSLTEHNRDKIIFDFIEKLKNNELKEESMLVTFLPKQFKPNEKKEENIASVLPDFIPSINACEIHKHYYYE